MDVGDAGDDGIEEVAIVRDEDDRVGIGAKVLLEPVAGLEVEMIGRLVEQQQVRPSEQQLGERDPHLPAAGERFAGPAGVLAAESQTAQHGGDAQVHAVAFVQPESILELGVARQHRVVLASGGPTRRRACARCRASRP